MGEYDAPWEDQIKGLWPDEELPELLGDNKAAEDEEQDLQEAAEELVNETLIRTKEYDKLLAEKRINKAEYQRLLRLKSGRKASGKNSWTTYADNPQNRAIDRVGKVRQMEAVKANSNKQ